MQNFSLKSRWNYSHNFLLLSNNSLGFKLEIGKNVYIKQMNILDYLNILLKEMNINRSRSLTEWRGEESKAKTKCYSSCKENERVQDQVFSIFLVH